MNKNVTICFRTNEKLRNGLEAVAREENRSISSAIEIILMDHLRRHREVQDQTEKRRYNRKNVAIPVLVKSSDPRKAALEGGVLVDVSLGGICVSVPKESGLNIEGEGASSQFEAAFVLPDVGKPVRMLCQRRRAAANGNGDIHVGASFVDGDFIHYQQLQQYLM